MQLETTLVKPLNVNVSKKLTKIMSKIESCQIERKKEFASNSASYKVVPKYDVYGISVF